MLKTLKLLLISLIVLSGLAYADTTKNKEDDIAREALIKDKFPNLTEERKAQIRKEFMEYIIKEQSRQVKEMMEKIEEKKIEELSNEEE